jgi:hypothetical protein
LTVLDALSLGGARSYMLSGKHGGEMIEHKDAPGWQFSLKEVSAGVWRIDGQDASGRSVSRTGTDDAALLRQGIEDARSLGLKHA